MTNKPREFKFKIYRTEHGFNIVYDHKTTIEMEIGEYHTIEAAPVLEKIKRLEAALEQCKDQRDWWIHEKYEGAETKDIDALVEQENARLESILEGR